MPNAASTNGRNKATVRSRQRIPGRGSHESAKAPVLFRLREIETKQLSPAAPVPAGIPANAPAVKSPGAAEESVVVSQSIETPSKAVDANVDSAELTHTHSAVEATTASQPVAARSWWDHWSSGLVLVLLIIALVTASIVAFTDSGHTDPSFLADGKTGESQEFALGEFNIPDASPVHSSQPSTIIPADEADIQPSSPVQLVIDQSLAILAPQTNDTAKTEEGAIELTLGNLPTEESLVPDLLTTPPETQSANEALPAVSLEQPVGTGDSSMAQVNTTVNHVPVRTDNTPPNVLKTATLGTPKPSMNPNLVPPLPSQTAETTLPVPGQADRQSGASPDFYDEAKLSSINQQTIATPLVTHPAIQDTQQQSYESLLGGNAKTAPTFTTISHGTTGSTNFSTATQEKPVQGSGTQNTTAVAPSTGLNTNLVPTPVRPQETRTPGSDSEALVREYQKFRQLNQIETGNAPINRYPRNAPVRQPTQAPTSNGAGTVYTLGNPTASVPGPVVPSTAPPNVVTPRTATTGMGGATIR